MHLSILTGLGDALTDEGSGDGDDETKMSQSDSSVILVKVTQTCVLCFYAWVGAIGIVQYNDCSGPGNLNCYTTC